MGDPVEQAKRRLNALEQVAQTRARAENAARKADMALATCLAAGHRATDLAAALGLHVTSIYRRQRSYLAGGGVLGADPRQAPDPEDVLQAYRRAVRQRRKFRAAAAAALDHAPVTEIAEVAGVTRAVIYQWRT